jgi:squalene synthase HpnC
MSRRCRRRPQFGRSEFGLPGRLVASFQSNTIRFMHNGDARNGFARALALLGPESSFRPYSLEQAQAYCRTLTNTHYENFSVASLLLPRRLLTHFHAIYAYCRWADDLGDETGGGERALKLLQWWRAELKRCFAGQPRHPVMIALAPTIRRFQISPEPFEDLIHAFEQDQHVQRYDSYPQLLDYCRYSANPVGRLVLYLCESFDETKAALADAVCTGLQLANFWQDVKRDLDIGRVYLPADDRRFFGYSDADLEARRFTPGFRDLLRFEVERARALFRQGTPLVTLMPRDVQADIDLFIRGGERILDKIAAQDYNVWRRRPALKKWEKAALVGGVLWRHAKKSIW